MTEKKISVIILNWNGAAMMRRFLPSVVEHSAEAEVIVADNGSTDDSLEMLKEEFPTIRVIPFEKNYGFAEGYNKALEKIETPYALLLNDDVEVTRDWLVPLLTFMESHPKVAACQPKLLSEKQRDHFEYAGACGGFLDYLGYPYCRGRMMEVVEKDEGQYDTPCAIFWGSGAALMVRTAIYKEVGGLDRRFFAHMEEIDFCWRLRSRGHEIYCIPQSTVYHVGGGTLSKSNPKKTFLNFRNNLLMLHKNMPTGQLTFVLLARYFLDHLAACKMLLSGQRNDALAVIRARYEFNHIRHEYDNIREENLRKTVTEHIPELRNSSLLFAFYFRHKHRFSDWV
ncbi:MAG: glycosyltransferase family 2 protein [Bacteroidaceae bacterium]|nr:glycosyltransferase family 2 protein [Bacteroidaceae bacterium]